MGTKLTYKQLKQIIKEEIDSIIILLEILENSKNISSIIKDTIKKFKKKYDNISPYEINNGFCDEFCQDAECLQRVDNPLKLPIFQKVLKEYEITI